MVCVNLNVREQMQWRPGVVCVDVADGSDMQIQYDEGAPTMVYRQSFSPDSQFRVKLSDIVVRTSPFYHYEGHDIEYRLVGFDRDMNAVDPTYTIDAVLDSSAFDDGQEYLVLHAIWKPKEIVVKFDPGFSDIDGSMPDMFVGTRFTTPTCKFFEKPSIPRFTYKESQSDKWEKVEPEEQDFVPRRRFTSWRCVVAGFTTNVDEGQIVDCSRITFQIPVVALHAQWEDAWDRIEFWVGDEVYCEALVDKRTHELRVPKDPVLTDNRVFMCWDRANGEILLDEPDVGQVMVICDTDGNVVCGESTSDEDIICNPDADMPIVCDDSAGIVCDGSS